MVLRIKLLLYLVLIKADNPLRAYLLLFLLIPLLVSANVNIDSLWDVWNDPNQADTNKLKAMKQISWDGYLFIQPDSAFHFAQLGYDYAQENGLKKYMAEALNTQGVSFAIQGDYDRALDYYMRSLKINEEMGDKKATAASLNNIGNIFNEKGGYSKAIDYYMRSLKIKEEVEDEHGIANSSNNIGNNYKAQGDYSKAIDFYQRSQKIFERLGNRKGVSDCANNLGNAYRLMGEMDKALGFYMQSLRIKEEVGDKRGIAVSLNNVSNIYREQGDFEQAMDAYMQSLKTFEEIGDKRGTATCLNGIAGLYQKQGSYYKALEMSSRALTIARKIGSLDEIKDASRILWETNYSLNRYKTAFNMYQLYVATKDSLQRTANKKELIRQEYKYAYEKQKVADSIAAAEQIKVKDALLQAEYTKSMRRRQQSYFLYSALALALIFGLFIFNRYKAIEEQKKVIFDQKAVVEATNTELMLAKKLIQDQNNNLENNISLRTIELAESHEKLKRRFRQLEQFSFLIAHKMRSPVARILGLSYLINQEAEADKSLKILIDAIMQTAKDLDEVMHDVSDIIGIQNTISNPNAEVNIHDVLKRVKHQHGKDILAYGVIISHEFEDKIIYSDQNCLTDILSELFDNAIKFRSENRPLEINIIEEKKDSHYHIRFYDNAEGFDSKKVERQIFEPFQRFNKHVQGKGLGLFTVKNHVMALGGTITCQSEQGRGTQFEITLPILTS